MDTKFLFESRRGYFAAAIVIFLFALVALGSQVNLSNISGTEGAELAAVVVSLGEGTASIELDTGVTLNWPSADPNDTSLFANLAPTRIVWVQAGAASTSADGSLERPFPKIVQATNIATPGTAVLVRAGSYNEFVKLPSQKGGTPEAPIWLISADGPYKAKIIAPSGTKASIQGLGVKNWVIEGFELTGPAAENGIQLSMSGSPSTDYSLWDDYPQRYVQNVVVRGNLIHDQATGDNIKVSQAEGVQILDNIGYDPGGEDCIDFVATINSIIARNDCSGALEAAAIYAKGGSADIEVYDNYVHNVTAPVNGITLGGQGDAAFYWPSNKDAEVRRMVVRNNKVEGVRDYPVSIKGAIDSQVYNNYLSTDKTTLGYTMGVNFGYRKEDTGSTTKLAPYNVEVYDNVIVGTKPVIGYATGITPEANLFTVYNNVRITPDQWTQPVGPKPLPRWSPAVTITASPETVPYAGTTTLSWVTENAASCTAGGAWSGEKATSGSETVTALTSSGNYSITCTGAGGTVTKSVTVTVLPPPTPTLTFRASPSTIPYQGSSSLIWVSTNATSCKATKGWTGAKALSGSETVSGLTNNRTYEMSCTGLGGTVSKGLTVKVTPPPPPEVSLTADPTTVAWMGSAVLSWTTTGANSCTASGGWSGSRATNDTATLTELETTDTYRLSCTNAGGTTVKEVVITVQPPPPPTLSLTSDATAVEWMGDIAISWSSINTDSCTASGSWSGDKQTSGSEAIADLTAGGTYTLSCVGPGGSIEQSVSVAVGAQPAPTLNFRASPSTISKDGSSTLIWSSTNATTCKATKTWTGTKPLSGSEVVSGLTNNRSYEMSCTGPSGTVVKSLTVKVE